MDQLGLFTEITFFQAHIFGLFLDRYFACGHLLTTFISLHRPTAQSDILARLTAKRRKKEIGPEDLRGGKP